MLGCSKRAPQPPKPVLDPCSNRDVALYALTAALNFGTWVHRRIETISFPDSEAVCREMTVDFTMPVGEGLTPGETVLVPLYVLSKTELRRFDLTDEEGRALPNLTATQSGEVTRRALKAVLSSGWSEGDGVLDGLLAEVVPDRTDTPDGGLPARDEGGHRGKRRQRLLAGVGEQLRTVLDGFVEELESGLLLLVPMPYDPSRRRLVTFSYEASKFVRAMQVPLFARAYRRLNRVLSSFGVVARQEDFEDLQVGWTSSYHVEALPPDEMWVAEAVLEIQQEEAGGQRRISIDHHRPHLQRSGGDRGERAELTLLLSPRRESLIFPLSGSAAAIAAALAFVPGHLDDLDPQVLGGLLLLPFALVAYYVRGSEHRYVSMALRGVRMLAGIPVLAALVVLGMLGLGLLGEGSRSGEAGYEIAVWASRVSVLATVALLPALISPNLGGLVRWTLRQVERLAGPKVRRGLAVVLLLAGVALAVTVTYLVVQAIYQRIPV